MCAMLICGTISLFYQINHFNLYMDLHSIKTLIRLKRLTFPGILYGAEVFGMLCILCILDKIDKDKRKQQITKH